ncbi:MAG: NAD(P)-dependent glycerol-3-phosphate dehydrogenase [Clostridiales bacterium]|nr:NAD(P)-dependent glycerol-3-phosphate dehydrogenase [Clostridiales bacterium]
MATIFVMGAGWGTALSVMFDRYGHMVTLWSPFEEELEEIRRYGEHKRLLPGVPVPPSIHLTCDLDAAKKAEIVVMAVPSFAIRKSAAQLKNILSPGVLVANAGKGLEENTYQRFTQVIREELPHAHVVALSGPSHAEEVGRGVPTTIVSASSDQKAAERVQELLMNERFRIYANTDEIGVELGGALKNVIALAAGVCDGLNIGDNAKAALMTRGLAEIARLGVAMGASSETFAGLSGMGDLIVTCSSLHSRNRRAGMLIGQGVSPKEAVHSVGTVEGYYASRAGWELSQRMGVEMPITAQCYRICYEGQSPQTAILELMARPRRHESESPWVRA